MSRPQVSAAACGSWSGSNPSLPGSVEHSTPGAPESSGEPLGQHKPTDHSTEEAFRAFIDELAAGTADLLTRMKLGHEPDEHGWCRHTTHERHWESHPCPVLRLAQLAEINSGPPMQ
jgi:hypothetical protein